MKPKEKPTNSLKTANIDWKKVGENIAKISAQNAASPADPLGSYTGRPTAGDEPPEQDADDL